VTAWVPGCETGPQAGQSGSENLPDDGPSGGGVTVPCPCWNEPALRVTVLSQDQGNLRLQVEEVLHGELPLLLGDVIEASRSDDRLACFEGCAAVDTGEQAFAFFSPSEPALPACPEREACVAACEAQQSESERAAERDGDGDGDDDTLASSCLCRADPPRSSMSISTRSSRICGLPLLPDWSSCWEQCTQDTLDRCPPRPEQDFKRGTVRLSPWGDKIVFARNARGEISLPAAELGQLWSDQGSDERENARRCRERVGDWSTLLENAP
jgi:hypothetical protein